MALFLSIFPIVLLIYLMVKRNPVPSYIALPMVAILVYLIKVFYFDADLVLVNASVVSGYISTLSPITVIFGAILFHRTLENSGALNTLRQWLSNINPNPVAQLMIIAWAFAFMLEGASGFGTPPAIAAPILIGLGFKPFRVACLALAMNSVPVSFGAVGVPTWFGFSPLGLSVQQTLEVSGMTALIHSVAAFIIPVIALLFVVEWKEVKRNILFVYISIIACVVPYFLLAQINYEFPSLAGGAIGLLISIVVANFGIGLAKVENAETNILITTGQIFKALSPTLLLIAVLVVTRLPQLPFNAMIQDKTEWLSFSLGYLGDFTITKGLVLSLNHIFATTISDNYRLLYVPALIPFGIVSLLTFFIYRLTVKEVHEIAMRTIKQGIRPFWAMFGSLVMVKLMTMGGDSSMVKIIGTSFASVAGESWTYFSAYLGAIGSFFSGSNTVSNLTFGGVQFSTAELVGLNTSLILALQSVGGAMGNMICVNNIIAVSTIVNLQNQEGEILKKTTIPMLIYGVIAAIAATFIVPLFYSI
ncbi:L-lactate permease [Lonepinella koalarum]|uniref:L-lactate permease n=1 Tax=Lonepinella koalarum TaxID=53417 RepID=A0A4R1KYA7_9PAST|nr:L-lactate permease [Lonepinella koalarum]MDH2926873.1 lactate permease [Lonepinella koalarum]TCK70468.1 lactate permease [Lonepinella koalarum]TFJ90145.1 L-lactate permease [Lonepinella koalarum]